MAPPSRGPVWPVVVGVSHKTAAAELRDRLFAEEAQQPALLEGLKESGLDQALLLSTCDRTEVNTVTGEPEVAVATIAGFLARRAGVPPEELLAQAYRLQGEAALRHVFAVAASLDSAIVGEPHVLGQVKGAHRLAKAAGLVGPELERVLQAAYAAAKRVRSETGIAERAVSVAAVATQLVRDLHGDPGRCAGLVLGAGEMGEFLAEHLRQAGLSRWTIAHPSPRRAELAAVRFGGHYVGLDGLEETLARADVVLAALGAGRPVIDPPIVRAALRTRRSRPILFIDAAVPRAIDPAIADLEEAFLYDVEDLERLALEGRSNRAQAADAAWQVVESEVAAFLSGQDARRAVPAVVVLRRHFEAVREDVLANGTLDPAEATRLLINRLLHEPSEALRRLAAEGGDTATAEALLRRLFTMDDEVAAEHGAGDEEIDA